MTYRTTLITCLSALLLVACNDPTEGFPPGDVVDKLDVGPGETGMSGDIDGTDNPNDNGGMEDAIADGSGGDTSGTQTRTLTLDMSNSTVGLPQLADGYQWESWLVTADGPSSTGTFAAKSGTNKYTWQVAAETATAAERFVLSIEPKPDDDPAPSAAKFLSGELGDSSAQVSVKSTIGDFSGASGSYTLNAPTADDPASKATHGIWFIQPGQPPSAGFQKLPDLSGKGWAYEGWVVDVSGSQPKPYTTGKFADAPESWTKADRDGAGPSAGPTPDAAPDYPGSDFVGGDGGNNFDLTAGGNWRAVLSVEPQIDGADTSPAPFVLKPFQVKIQSDTETKKAKVLNLKLDSLPSGKVELD